MNLISSTVGINNAIGILYHLGIEISYVLRAQNYIVELIDTYLHERSRRMRESVRVEYCGYCQTSSTARRLKRDIPRATSHLTVTEDRGEGETLHESYFLV